MRLFKVGGCVRDAFLGRASKDIDFAVEAESFDAMRQGVVDMGGEIFVEHPEFLTIRAKTPEFGATDFVLARKDGEYVDGRRPETVEPGTIADDLARRDFRMNAIAIDVSDNSIIDPFKGQEDISNKIIRCVGDPQDRFAEDALRVFRALRFSIVLGFKISSSIKNAVKFGQINYDGVATERIRDELFKAFKADSFAAFEILNEFSLVELVKSRGIWFKPTVESR